VSTEENKDVKERIFLVGDDDPTLLRTRVYMLEDWQTTTANTREAEAAMTTQPFDLLIIGQTVPDETAKSLIALANTLHPPATTLVICGIAGSDRHFGTATYRIDLTNPGGFRSAVARLLDSRPNTGFLGP
jgi:DNA-binding NtrC family response regulator